MKRVRDLDLQSGDTAPLPRLERPVIVFPRQHWRTIRPVERRVMQGVYRTRKDAPRTSDDLWACVLAVMVGVVVLAGLRSLAIAMY